MVLFYLKAVEGTIVFNGEVLVAFAHRKKVSVLTQKICHVNRFH